jgi:hypothetical protein
VATNAYSRGQDQQQQQQQQEQQATPSSSQLQSPSELRSTTEEAVPSPAVLAAVPLGSAYVTGLAEILKLRMCEVKSSMALKDGEELEPPSPFHSKSPSKVGIDFYLARIHNFFQCSDTCFVLALVYMDRIARRKQEMKVSARCCHRLLLTSLVVATKFNDDEEHFSNAFYAKVGGLSPVDLLDLEVRFCEMLDWTLDVEPLEYARYSKLLHSTFLHGHSEDGHSCEVN